MITFLLLALGGLAIAGVVASIVTVSHDGYRRVPAKHA
jgi:hypothetical protein